MQNIKWGIIGCGDVTEVKSGPAFNKVPNSALVAVMRRNAAKAADYALRHGVPRWYSNADDLINDPDVNAVYIATPPSSHEEYSIAALQAGKPVYIEKPITLTAASAKKILNAVQQTGIKASVAHYRRQQPYFQKIKSLIDGGAIGSVRFVHMRYCNPPLTEAQLQKEGYAWRVNPALSGGGLFHDLAPHGLDLMYYFFGKAERVQGIATNQGQGYAADDLVTGTMQFQNSVVFNGLWCFAVAPGTEEDYCEVRGEAGTLKFSVFGTPKIELTVNGNTETILFEPLQHVQHPMIAAVVQYFLGAGTNPCSVADGLQVMEWMDAFTTK